MTPMIRRAPRVAWRTMVLALVSTGALAAPPTDRRPPTTPTNLRITAVTSYSVSLAWNPSTDNSGQVRYKICCANVSSDHSTALRHTRAVVYANRDGVNTFAVAAVDSAGNRSDLSAELSETFEGCVF